VAGLLALGLAVAAPAAAAHSRLRMTFDFASLVAVDYWAQRRVTVPCWLTVERWPLLAGERKSPSCLNPGPAACYVT
jgi:hypothetical protein